MHHVLILDFILFVSESLCKSVNELIDRFHFSWGSVVGLIYLSTNFLVVRLDSCQLNLTVSPCSERTMTMFT